MIHWEGVLAVSIMISPIILLGLVVWYSDYTASKQNKKSIEKYLKRKNNMERFLKAIGVLQEKRVPHPLGEQVLVRLNPLNPLTYTVIALMIPLSILMFGLISTINDLKKNPFRYS